jgi:hypothetical protein
MTTPVPETSNKIFTAASNSAAKKSPLCREYCKESHTITCRGPPYSTDPVTMETWRAWTWQTGSWAQCHVMLAERTTILEHWIFYQFIPLGFPFLLLGHISPKEKRWDRQSTSVLCTYKNSGFVEDFFATVSTILPKRFECSGLQSRLCSNLDECTVDLKRVTPGTELILLVFHTVSVGVSP